MNYKLIARRLRAMAEALDEQALKDMDLKEYLAYLKENLNGKSVTGTDFQMVAEFGMKNNNERDPGSLEILASGGSFPNIPNDEGGIGIIPLIIFDINENSGKGEVSFGGDEDIESFYYDGTMGVNDSDMQALVDSRAKAEAYLNLFSKAIKNIESKSKELFG